MHEQTVPPGHCDNCLPCRPQVTATLPPEDLGSGPEPLAQQFPQAFDATDLLTGSPQTAAAVQHIAPSPTIEMKVTSQPLYVNPIPERNANTKESPHGLAKTTQDFKKHLYHVPSPQNGEGPRLASPQKGPPILSSRDTLPSQPAGGIGSKFFPQQLQKLIEDLKQSNSPRDRELLNYLLQERVAVEDTITHKHELHREIALKDISQIPSRVSHPKVPTYGTPNSPTSAIIPQLSILNPISPQLGSLATMSQQSKQQNSSPILITDMIQQNLFPTDPSSQKLPSTSSSSSTTVSDGILQNLIVNQVENLVQSQTNETRLQKFNGTLTIPDYYNIVTPEGIQIINKTLISSQFVPYTSESFVGSKINHYPVQYQTGHIHNVFLRPLEENAQEKPEEGDKLENGNVEIAEDTAKLNLAPGAVQTQQTENNNAAAPSRWKQRWDRFIQGHVLRKPTDRQDEAATDQETTEPSTTTTTAAPRAGLFSNIRKIFRNRKTITSTLNSTPS